MLLSIYPPPNATFVYDNLMYILEYYEQDENLKHVKIGLFSDFEPEEFEPYLKYLREKCPNLILVYAVTDNDNKTLCREKNIDLSVMVPQGLLDAESGVFKYGFQSHKKNIFGTLSVEIVLENNSIVTRNEQIFTTSIGD